MAQAIMTVRIDADKKVQFENLCRDFGMSVNTAFTIFVNSVIRNQGIPFKIESDRVEKSASQKGWEAFEQLRAQAASLPEMTLDEINEEIAAVRAGK